MGTGSAWAKSTETSASGASGSAWQTSTGGASGSAWQSWTAAGGNPVPTGPPVKLRPNTPQAPGNFQKKSKAESFWLRNAYSDLVERLKERLKDSPEADQKIEAALRQVHLMRTGEEYVETGNDLRTRWRKWVKEMTVAISHLTEENLQTTIEMVSEDTQRAGRARTTGSVGTSSRRTDRSEGRRRSAKSSCEFYAFTHTNVARNHRRRRTADYPYIRRCNNDPPHE